MEIDLSSVQRVQDRVKSWTSSKTRNIKQSETRESPSSSWKQLYRKRRAPSHDGDASTTHTAWNVGILYEHHTNTGITHVHFIVLLTYTWVTYIHVYTRIGGSSLYRHTP